MKKNLIVLVILAVAAVTLSTAQEKIALGTPVAQPSLADYRPGNIFLQTTDAPAGLQPRIVITVLRSDNKGEVFEYPCTNGCTAMDTAAEVQATITALNSTVNMGTRSLWRRIFDRLIADFPERFPNTPSVQD